MSDYEQDRLCVLEVPLPRAHLHDLNYVLDDDVPAPILPSGDPNPEHTNWSLHKYDQ